MFDFLVFILINAFWFTLFLGPVTVVIYRLIYALKFGETPKEKWLMVCLPISFGFFQYEKNQPRWGLIYRIILLVFITSTILASFFIYFTEVEFI